VVSNVIFTGCVCVPEELIQTGSFEAYVEVNKLMLDVVKASGVIWLLHYICCCLFVYTHKCAYAHAPFIYLFIDFGKLCYVCLSIMIKVSFL